MRACPHCTEKSGRQLDRFCSRGRGSVRAATAGTVAPSHLLLKFGKLTQKFELLYQFRKAENRRPFAATYGKVVPSRLSYLRSVSCRLKFEVLCKKLKVRSFRTSVGRLTGAGGARRGRDDGRHDCERGMNDGRVGRCAACGGCGWYGRCAGRRGGCGAVLSAPSKKTRLPTAALFAIFI